MRVRRETTAYVCLSCGFHSRKRQTNFSNWMRWLALMLVLSTCSLFAADSTSIVLVGGGSTVPLALYKKWKEEYNKLNRPVQMDYVPFGAAVQKGYPQLPGRLLTTIRGKAISLR